VKDGVVMEIGVSVRRWRSRDKAVEIWIMISRWLQSSMALSKELRESKWRGLHTRVWCRLRLSNYICKRCK